MGSSLLKLGGVAVRETGEQLLKRLAGENDRSAKVIGSLAGPFAEAVIKEIDEYPPAAKIVSNYVRNDIPGFQQYGQELMQGSSNKQTAKNLSKIVKQNKPQPEPYQTNKLFEEDTTRTVNQEITGKGRSKEEVAQFYETKKSQEAIGSHHHIDDLKFIGNALNREDKPEILQIIQELRPGTEFGDRKAGLIGAMDQKTTGFRASARGDIAKQIKDFDQLPLDKQKRLLNDLQKEAKDTGDDYLEEGEGLFKVNKQYDLKTSASGNLEEAQLVQRKKADFGKATDPESYGLPRDLDKPIYSGKGKRRKIKGYKVADKWPDGRPVTTDDLRSAYQNRLKRLNIDRKKIKYDSSQTILPKDHIELIHYAGYNSPEFKVKREIEALMASGEWLKKPWG